MGGAEQRASDMTYWVGSIAIDSSRPSYVSACRKRSVFIQRVFPQNRDFYALVNAPSRSYSAQENEYWVNAAVALTGRLKIGRQEGT